jgi:hypothetical protein
MKELEHEMLSACLKDNMAGFIGYDRTAIAFNVVKLRILVITTGDSVLPSVRAIRGI